MTHEVCCQCPVHSVILFWLLSLEKALLHRGRGKMLEMEARFSVLFWQSQHIPLESRMYGDLKLSQIYFQGHHHLQSQAVDPLLAQTKFIHLVYSQMGHRSIPCQFGHLLWSGINAQTLLKAEIGDHEPAGRKKALTQSLSKSLLMFKTYQNSYCSLVALIIPVWLWMQTLYPLIWTELSFFHEMTN